MGTLENFYEDRGKYLNLLRNGDPNKSGDTKRQNNDDKNRGAPTSTTDIAKEGKVIDDLKAFMTTLIKEAKTKKPGAGGRTRKHKRREIDWSETDSDSDDTQSDAT